MALKDENFYVVCGWMRNLLNLDGNDLIVYAVIYSYSQDGMSELVGGIKHLMDCTGCCRRTVIGALTRLEERGLIMVDKRNKATGKPNTYKAVPLDLLQEGGVQKLHTGVCKICIGGVQKLHTHIGNNICKKERKKEDINKSISASAHARDFSSMSDEELLDYKDGIGAKSIAEFDLFEWQALSEELKRRGSERQQFKGKIVVNERGEIERLKSYDEVMDGFGVSDMVKEALYAFIRHCSANKHTITNAKLEDIIMRLEDYEDDSLKVDALNEAINFGYFDIRQKQTALGQYLSDTKGGEDGTG